MVLIGHRYGNTPEKVKEANAIPEVDMVEIDLWYHGDKFPIRHGRKISRLPLLYDEGHWVPEPPSFTLDDLSRLPNTKGLFLDLKTQIFPFSVKHFVRSLANHLEGFPSHLPVILTSRNWRLLEMVREHDSRAQCYFAVRNSKDIHLLKKRIEEGLTIDGVNVDHLLYIKEEDAMRYFHEKGIPVSCWIVNRYEIAEALIKMGASVIISDNPFLLSRHHRQPHA